MSLSKSFRITMHGLSCIDVYHPGETCIQSYLANIKRLLPALSTYFTPLVFIPVFRNIKNLGWEDIQEALYLYFTMIGTVTVIGTSMTGSLCLTRHILGKFKLWSTIFVPVFFANSGVFLLPQRGAAYFANTIVPPLLESHFRRDNKWYWRLIGSSKMVRTIIFMAMSAIIMDTSSRLKSDVFWFLQSLTYKQIPLDNDVHSSPWIDAIFPCNRRVCQHSNSCDSHIISGFKTYLNIGLVLEMVRILFKRFSVIRSNPTEIFKIFASNINLRLIAFLVGYATSYRTLDCTLARLFGKPTAKSNIFAALLSGISYTIYPSLTILAHSIASAGKLIWMRCVELADNKYTFLNAINALPLSQIVYMMCIAYAFHIRAFYPHSTAGFIHKTAQYTTGMRFDGVTESIGSILMGMRIK